MPQISRRGSEMPASPIRKLVPFAEAAKARGVKIYHLNIGQPDIKTPPAALEAVRNAKIEVLEYSHSAGFESYRRKLTGYYKSIGVNVDHTEIMITTGGSEALLFGMMSCLNAGDEVIVPEPFYANYNGFARAGDIVVKPITARIEDGFALPPMSDFEACITPKTKAILICNPGNPTGCLYSREELEQLKDIVLRHDLFLFADEVYREFCYDGQSFTSIMQLEGLEQNAIIVDSISKRYSACGARIGALVTHNKEVYNAAMKFAQARLSPPTLEQILGEATLDTPNSYIEEVIEEYSSRRDIMVEGLRSIPGVVCPNPGGAFYAMVKLPIDDSDKFCQWMLESFNHNGETVMMAPGTGFYATPGLGKQEVRIAYVLKKEDLKAAITVLAEGLKAYQSVMAAASA
jgi:aspartate aminotransferase